MSVTATLTRQFSTGQDTISKQVQQTSGALLTLSESIPDGSNNLLVAFNLDYSQAKMIFIQSDKALTIKTNSSGAPDQAISVVADQPIAWAYGDTDANPITADITALYVTNASGAAAALEIRVLVDPTV